MNGPTPPFNFLAYPTDLVFLVVLWRYKLSLRDLAAMFVERGIAFTHETVRDWEARFAPRIAEQLRTLHSMGKTIVISSHILLELAEMCTDVAIIQGGHLVIAGSVDQVMHSLGGAPQLEVRVLDRLEDARKVLETMRYCE